MSIERVLISTDTVGGVWTFTLELAEALAARNIEVVLAALGGRASATQKAEIAAISGVRLLDSDFKLEWMENPWEDVEESGRWLSQIAWEYSPDVVHLNSFGHADLPFSAPVVLTAHSCVLSWWQAVKGEAAPSSWNRYRATVQSALSSASLITVPSATMASSLLTHYSLRSKSCRVIPNARSASRFYAGNKEPFILTAGRLWDEAKNVQSLVRTAAELPWPVYLAGDSHCDGSQNCHQLGKLSAFEITGWYARASIYVMPARYEPFGLSILEAALSCCALVLGDIPSLREIWGDAALFVPPGDSAALQHSLSLLINDPHHRQIMASRAQTRALKFDTASFATAYLNTYSDAIQLRSHECVS